VYHNRKLKESYAKVARNVLKNEEIVYKKNTQKHTYKLFSDFSISLKIFLEFEKNLLLSAMGN